MENRHLERVHSVMTTAALPEATRLRISADLTDAAVRGFHIDIEQLRCNLEKLAPGRAACL